MLPVFASANVGDINNDYLNDTNSFLFQFPSGFDPIAAGSFQLQQQTSGVWSTVATLNNSTYGSTFGTNCGVIGFKIKWYNVLRNLGTGTYRFIIQGAAPSSHFNFCGNSPAFCLQAYTTTNMDGTVKFETTYTGGVQGDVNQQGNSFSLCCTDSVGNTTGAVWNDSIRFAGFFGYQTGEIKREENKYATGIINKVRDEIIKKFILKTDQLPKWLLDRFMAYGLAADQLYVSDYNINNADYNLKKFFIVAASDFAPKNTNYSRYSKILDLNFQEGQQSIFRNRCC